jgi:O-antigen/teichoic acid export membrane protein
MGAYLSLFDIGTYGLVLGAVIVACAIIGVRVDFLVSRELVDAPSGKLLRKMRDQAVFYGVQYVLGAALAWILYSAGTLSGKIAFYILALTTLESFGNMTATNMVAMRQQVRSTTVFFVRSASWAIAISALGIADARFRSVDAVLNAWLLGSFLSIVMTFWFWRALPWTSLRGTPVDWSWILRSVKKCLPLWLGVAGLTAGSYIDRFVIDHVLGLEFVGVLTFYRSFTNGLLDVVYSGVLLFSFPKLIAFHASSDVSAFREETRRMIRDVFVLSSVTAIGIGIVVLKISALFHHPEFAKEAVTLWLLLAGTWLRANAEALYNVLYARLQDRQIWAGNLLFLVPAIGGNALLVPFFGLAGAGWAALLSGLFLYIWRLQAVRAGDVTSSNRSLPAKPVCCQP